MPQLQADHEDHGEEIYVEEKKSSAVDSAVSKLDKEIENLRVQLEPLELERKQLEEELKALTTKSDDLRGKITTITYELEELEVERYMHQYKYSTD